MPQIARSTVEGALKEKWVALSVHTRRGWPLGKDNFLTKIEKSLIRRIRPLPPGRPCRIKEQRNGKSGVCPR